MSEKIVHEVSSAHAAVLLLVVLLLKFAPSPLDAETRSAGTAPATAWGEPDLQDLDQSDQRTVAAAGAIQGPGISHGRGTGGTQ